jgi:hypothetical protein
MKWKNVFRGNKISERLEIYEVLNNEENKNEEKTGKEHL